MLRIRIQGVDDQKLKKIAIYLCLGLIKGRPSSKLQEKPSKENIPYLKKWNLLTFFHFCGSFLPPWIQTRLRIRIHDPIEYGTNPDPDPQHWWEVPWAWAVRRRLCLVEGVWAACPGHVICPPCLLQRNRWTGTLFNIIVRYWRVWWAIPRSRDLFTLPAPEEPLDRDPVQ